MHRDMQNNLTKREMFKCDKLIDLTKDFRTQEIGELL